MTIEGDILEKLKSVKKGIKELRKTEHVDTTEKSPAPDRVNVVSNNGRITYSLAKGSSVIFLFDATGSMSNFWSETQKIMKEMVERITKVGNVKLKCVAYRDHCDGSRIFEKSGWHTEAEPLIDFIREIKCNGGGDTPEAVEDALKLAYDEKETVTRVILIGDAPPHSLGEAVKQATNLGKKGRPVFAFLVGRDETTSEYFSRIAKASNGAFGELRNYKDLLDMMSIAIVHDVGGSAEVEKYIKKYGTSDSVREYSRSLPSYKK